MFAVQCIKTNILKIINLLLIVSCFFFLSCLVYKFTRENKKKYLSENVHFFFSSVVLTQSETYAYAQTHIRTHITICLPFLTLSTGNHFKQNFFSCFLVWFVFNFAILTKIFSKGFKEISKGINKENQGQNEINLVFFFFNLLLLFFSISMFSLF